MVGFAAAVSHRGVRLVRIPTTVLAQNDSAVGVKNSINAFHKKNFLGTFAPPFAVLNDFDFLLTLDDRDWRSGIAEAIKVALIKDTTFWQFIKTNAEALASRDMLSMQWLIHRCAQMHLDHIASGDPFEMGSSRPLDFGHWSAHKLEQLTNYELRHGEAVAIGIALDCAYAYLAGMLSKDELDEILEVMQEIGFHLFSPVLLKKEENPQQLSQLAIIKGLSEFREHLGGRLTITLLENIGKGKEVNQIDSALVEKAIYLLENYQVKINAQ
jgi:3-dehydroquinate synthase